MRGGRWLFASKEPEVNHEMNVLDVYLHSDRKPKGRKQVHCGAVSLYQDGELGDGRTEDSSAPGSKNNLVYSFFSAVSVGSAFFAAGGAPAELEATAC